MDRRMIEKRNKVIKEEEDIRQYAISLGYKVEERPNTGGSVSYTVGNIHIWKVGRSYPDIKIWWTCADLVDNRYQNHRSYETLREALEMNVGGIGDEWYTVVPKSWGSARGVLPTSRHEIVWVAIGQAILLMKEMSSLRSVSVVQLSEGKVVWSTNQLKENRDAKDLVLDSK